jgi:DNA polymerase elongation subunit (family B)
MDLSRLTVDELKARRAQLIQDVAKFSNKQMAVKIQLNSCYGALANAFFRWHDTKFAEAITSSGQLSTRWIEQKLNLFLNNRLNTKDVDYVLACDTDSVYIKLESLVKEEYNNLKDKKQITQELDSFCKQTLEPYIDSCYQELAEYMNAYSQRMVMKRECIADKAIWTAKKRYILNVYNQEGVAYETPKLKMQGIEAIRTSTPMVCRDGIKKALEVIMQKDEASLQQYIKDFRDQFMEMSFEQVAFPRSVKDLDKYTDRASIYKKGTPINVKGALIYNHFLKQMNLDKKYEQIGSGQKIKYAYCKMPNPLRCSVISCPQQLPEEFKMDKYIDRSLQFDKSFLEPVKTIVGAIGWECEHRATLESFFE